MANICSNRLFFRTESDSNYQKILENIKKNLSYCDINELGENECEIDFESRWVFPLEYFEELTQENPDETLYIRVLSYEFGCEYIAYHVYQNGEWADKLANR